MFNVLHRWPMPRVKKEIIFIVLSAFGMNGLLEGTDYVGKSVGPTDAALYFTDQTATEGDSFTGFVSFNGLRTSQNITIGTVGRLSTCLYANWPGSITLTDDLQCNSIFRISSSVPQGAAAIYGRGYTLSLTGSLNLNSSNNIAVQQGNLVIDGNGQTVTITGNSALYIDPAISVTLRNMTLVLKAQYPFSCRDHTASLTLDNVRVVMSTAFDTYYSTDAVGWGAVGLLSIERNVRFVGPGATFSHNTPQTLSLAPGATLTFETGTTFQYATGSAYRFYMADQTSKLRLNNCTLNVPSGYGMQLKNGMIEFDNRVFVENGGQSDSTKGLILGDGVSASNNVAVNILGGAYVIVDGVMNYKQA